jgi:hypothetical protein
VAFGRPKAERSLGKAQRDIDLRRLEGHRRNEADREDE